MQFFRKYFVPLALIFVGIAMIAFISRYFIGDEIEKKASQEIESVEIDFTKEGEISIFTGDTLLRTIDIEFARTPAERELGLMYRNVLGENQGMLFVFPSEEMRSFYMKNTAISLDILYINANYEIVSIVKNAKPYDETSLPSNAPAQYVLELNGGSADRWKIQVGDTISVSE